MLENLKTEQLYGELLSTLDQKYHGQSRSLWEFSLGKVVDGREFVSGNHEFLQAIYDDPHPFMVILKACQVCCSTYGILRSIFSAGFRGMSVGVYFHSLFEVTTYSKSRFAPLIEDNDDLSQMVKDTDSTNLKKIGRGWVHFDGMRKRILSRPLDLCVADEWDRAPNPDATLTQLKQRLAHSQYREVLLLSNPSLADYSIDKQYLLSDQMRWLVKCDSCNRDNDLIDHFPECLKETQKGIIRACFHCGKELDVRKGQWIPLKPGVRDIRGYQISQLNVPWITAEDLLLDYRTTTTMQEYMNLRIGVGYTDAQNRLTVEEVLSLCGNESISDSNRGPCFLGIDQGKFLHVCIGKRHPTKAGQIVHIGIYKDWEDLDGLMKNFRIARAVCDGLPEQRNARAFAERFKGKVFLNYYSQHQKGDYKWSEPDLTVQSNRTESLDASHKEIMDETIVLPKQCEMTQTFAEQLHNTAKRVIEDPETGSKRYQYIKLGADHFRHAFNYEAMARQFGTRSAFGDSDLS